MERHELYNGDVVMHYYDDKHKYMWDGKDLPSSTQITGIIDKPALRYWYVNQALSRVKHSIHPGVSYDEIQLSNILEKAKYGGKNAKDEAASVGRLVHDWIEDYVKSQLFGDLVQPPLPLHTGARVCVENFMKWEEEAKPKYIFSERRMISVKHEFAGTLDIAAYINDVPTIVDIKTGKRIYPEHWIQTASYALLLDEERPEGWANALDDMERRIILISQSTGILKEYKEESDIKLDCEVFLALRRVFRWKEKK